MKLTYTIELDVKRETGPNAKKDRVSGALINDLIRMLDGHEIEIHDPKDRSVVTEFSVRDAVVWPHEDSLPNAGTVAARSVVHRVPRTEPGSESVAKP